jgi:hypothetical protein
MQKNELKESSIYRLNLIVDPEGILWVGGRLRRSDAKYEEKHQPILPKRTDLLKLAITFHHEIIHHQGRLITNEAVRRERFWIVLPMKELDEKTTRKQQQKQQQNNQLQPKISIGYSITLTGHMSEEFGKNRLVR